MSLDHLKDLSPLDTFDKNVFIENDKYSQGLCNFILTLALIWNDIKNLLTLYKFMNKQLPKDIQVDKPEDMPIEPLWGEISGFKIFLEKHVVSIIHELFNLISNSKKEIESDQFKWIFKQLRKESKESWSTILKYSFGEDETQTNFGKILHRIRNKISNHYDKKEIFQGYKKKFIVGNEIPYISRGSTMAEHRFYFADAAAQTYYISRQETISEKDFYLILNSLQGNINFALQNIIMTFIQSRSAWRKIK